MVKKMITAVEVLKKIKARGYWQVIIRPTKFKKERLSLEKCSQVVQECQVRLRGWYYPHMNGSYVGGVDFVESLTDWGMHKEFWRMYQSGQFVHLFACIEDWLSEDPIFSPSHRIEPFSVLEVINALYTITEIYEFASRLARKELFEEAAFISVTLHRMKDRRLTFFDPRRSLGTYTCRIEDIPYERTITINELLGRTHDLSLDHEIRILEYFNWVHPPRDIFKEDQRKFLEGRR